MKKIATIMAVMAAGICLGAHAAAPAASSPAAAPWKDMSTCMAEAKGKVTAAKDAKVGGQAGVEIQAKPAVGKKTLKAGIQGATAADFPVGSDFCKIDFGAD